MTKAGVTLIEMLTAVVILSIITIPTIDLLSSFVTIESQFNADIKAKQHELNITEKMVQSIRPAAYVYKDNSTLTIPTQNGSTSVVNGVDSIAVLIPQFKADGTITMPSATTTTFQGIAFSIIPESSWDGSSSSKFVLVQTIFNSTDLDIKIDTNDPILIQDDPTTEWSTGNSYLLAANLKPGYFDNFLGDAFIISENRDAIEFALVSKADGLYFPSSSSSISIDDTGQISSVMLRNSRETTY